MDAEQIAELKRFLHMQSCIWPADGEGACIDTLHYIAELDQQVNFHAEVKAAFKETADSLLAENSELREQLSYQTDRAESFCARLHEEEQRNTELRQRAEKLSQLRRSMTTGENLTDGIAWLDMTREQLAELDQLLAASEGGG